MQQMKYEIHVITLKNQTEFETMVDICISKKQAS